MRLQNIQLFTKRHRTALLLGASVLAALLCIGGYIAWTYEPGADSSFDPRITTPALTTRRPRVLFDHGHHNAHSISGRFRPFADLLRADGCMITTTTSRVSPEQLSTCQVLVIVNASGPEPDRTASAFSEAEIAAIRTWIERGGSLLLAADHHPYGLSNAALARAFQVEMMGGWCEDEAHVLAGSADKGATLFDRAHSMLGTHPTLSGRGPTEEVLRVGTFTGQSLVALPQESGNSLSSSVEPLLLCSNSAMDMVPISSTSVTTGGTTTTTFETKDTSAFGHCVGMAMRVGKGRVVVLGEAAMLSAQIDRHSGLPFGMNVPGLDNRQFVLNTIRWLAGELP